MTSFHHLCRVAACLALAMAAQAKAAGQERRPADPADPNAAIPATPYKQALPYRPARQPGLTPDQNWKALNQAVGAINSMSLTMGRAHDPVPEPAAPTGPQRAAQAPAHHHHHEMKQ
jgi:hypothetical protein